MTTNREIGNINYPQLPRKPEEEAVIRSIQKPNAFSRPGTMSKTAQTNAKGTRFRPLVAKRAPVRKRKPDRRYVKFF